MGGWDVDDMPDQHGRTVLVTGANSGLGLRTSEALASKGALVLLACRDPQRGTDARDAVAAKASGPKPELVQLDLADLASVRRAADEVAGRGEPLDVLVNNAGVMALPRRETADGFEMQLGTNHFGHYALTGLLLPALLRAEGPRVVTVSSFGHKPGRMRWDDIDWQKGYSRWRAYFQSKLANLLFTYELDRRARAAGSPLVAAAAHPGYAATNLSAQGPAMAGNKVMLRLTAVSDRVFGQSDAQGALPQLYAATAPDVRGGEYFGPDGFLEQRGHPKRVGSTRHARNEADAARLWELSEQRTGVTYSFAL
jgi:NAD(P)-dependent dehydrogenase (short-subunit alcohol dehydrogenase family)